MGSPTLAAAIPTAVATPKIPPLRLTSPHESGPLPRTGVVLIGTRQTVEALRVQVEGLERAPVVTGCVLLGGPGAVAAARAQPLAGQTPILGTLADLPALHARYGFRFALVSVPASMPAAAEQARAGVEALGIPSKFIPTLADLLTQPEAAAAAAAPTAAQTLRQPAALDLAALVGRTPYDIDHKAVGAVLTGRRVLITGAGGSIGSELARVAAGFRPEMLILMERSENALFEIDRQMARRFPGVKRRAILHDVVDAEGTLRHLVSLRPHVVFHAAAHKHVPLMEDHPGHAVTNNLFGTKSIADAAVAVGAERFVMISTDKAVNPVSVMGASKRLAEMYVRSLAARGAATRLSMVRFGNVLGSACSVLTIWSAQLAEGGPLTVTDPRMTRYFMTIPEAATLVVQAAAMEPAEPGTAPVHVLDMGRPIRILDLAVRFARAHGLAARVRYDTLADPSVLGGLTDLPAAEPGSDAADRPTVEIVFTGARPGEKLHEELAYAAEQLRPTAHPGINAWAGPAPEGADAGAGLEMITDLAAVRNSSDRAAVLAAMRRHVPEMPASVLG